LETLLKKPPTVVSNRFRIEGDLEVVGFSALLAMARVRIGPRFGLKLSTENLKKMF
jgi:hypothetical protein